MKDSSCLVSILEIFGIKTKHPMVSKEHKRSYDRERYLEKFKPVRFGSRTCPMCEIMLGSKFGADNSRRFCRNCINRGLSKRFLNKEFYLKKKYAGSKSKSEIEKEVRLFLDSIPQRRKDGKRNFVPSSLDY